MCPDPLHVIFSFDYILVGLGQDSSTALFVVSLESGVCVRGLKCCLQTCSRVANSMYMLC